VGVGLFFLLNKPVTKNPNATSTPTSNSAGSGTITNKTSYTVEEGLEGVAPIASSAVESYLQQDTSESTNLRNKRLSAHFTTDSPVYGYGQQDINSSVNKSSAKITSIKSCEEQEGANQCLLVDTETTLYSNKSTNTLTRTYWLTLRTASDKSTLAFDIGEF